MFDYRAIMSGERRDPLAWALRAGLRVASVPYAAIVAIRNRRFDNDSLTAHECGVPVISVGNLTTGGTGKTPMVCWLAQWFRQRGLRVAIVSRGYGSVDGDGNDEALELHDRLPDVPHVQNPDRLEAARIAVEELAAELILMDDGFQHRRLVRHLNLVAIDATCPFGYGYLLPRGLLREPLRGLRRADAVVITRCDAVAGKQVDAIVESVAATAGSIPIARSTHRPAKLRKYPNQEVPIETLRGRAVAIVSAIGNPAAFEQTVRQCGGTVVDVQRLPDHDPYSPETVRQLRLWIEQLEDRIDLVVCTHKDLVKLRTDRMGGQPLAALMIEFELLDGHAELESLLNAIAASAQSPVLPASDE